MSSLKNSLDGKKLDSRLIDRNLSRAVITSDDVKKSVSTLPDDVESAAVTNVDHLQQWDGKMTKTLEEIRSRDL